MFSTALSFEKDAAMFTSTGISRGELMADGQKLVRRRGRQILLIASADGIFAIANRCPHEGYPLSEGTLGPDCILTCNWHNWKFDLRSGNALVGRDPARTYEVVERNGEILIDLTDPPADAEHARALKGLDGAIADVDLARMARETARLERAGFDAKAALVHAFATRNDFLEEGMTHAHAAAADWLALAERAQHPQERLAAVLEPLHHIAWDTQGACEFPYAAATEQWNPAAYVAALEAEDEPRAISLVRGAVADQVPYARLRTAIGEAALTHYADFGHCAIYALKTGQLIERLGEKVAEPALLALTRMLARATREERLPEFRGYAKALAEWNLNGQEPAHAIDFVGLSVDGALKRTIASSGRPMRELYDALVGAAAWNLLHFDTAFEHATQNPIADNVGWLDFTHALTFANASRHLCEDVPEFWPHAALQLALFVGRNRKYVRAEEDVARWSVNDRNAFLSREMSALYDHGITEPIIACHRLKVLFALEDELTAAPDALWADDMLRAVSRYLATPMKRHHGLRTAAQALDFVSKEA
jgi:nitrite reductase/ring-hydroxylating ferredoxin subunit